MAKKKSKKITKKKTVKKKSKIVTKKPSNKKTTKQDILNNSPFIPEPKKIIYFKRESPDSFTIRLDWKVVHDTGQFVFCSLPGIGEAPISICSFSNDYVELNIREVGNVTRALSNIKKGQKLLVRGPYGKGYPMHFFKGDSVVIIGGGCGVAPLKGIIEYVEHCRDDFKNVDLFLGFRTPGDILFEESLKKWQKKFKLNMSFDKMTQKTCYDAYEGFITTLVDNGVNDNRNKVVFICGPPIMIEKVVEILKKKNFNDDQIYVSAERLMYCGIGKCGRCMIHGKYTCLDGPVFRWDEVRNLKDD